jgi:hypothetical protein
MESITTAWNGEIVVHFDGRERMLRPSFRAIMDAEHLADASLITVSREFATGSPRVTTMAAVITACLTAGGARSPSTGQPYTLHEVGTAIMQDGRMSSWAEVVAALISHMLSGGQAGRAVLGEASVSIRNGLVLRIDGIPATSGNGPDTGPLPS